MALRLFWFETLQREWSKLKNLDIERNIERQNFAAVSCPLLQGAIKSSACAVWLHGDLVKDLRFFPSKNGGTLDTAVSSCKPLRHINKIMAVNLFFL